MANFENTLFPALEAALQAAAIPLDGAQLFEYPEIKAHARSPYRVADCLRTLWNRGLVSRLPAVNTKKQKRSLWRYQWRGERTTPGTTAHSPKVIANRPSSLLTEQNGSMTVKASNRSILIGQKPSTFLSYLAGFKNN